MRVDLETPFPYQQRGASFLAARRQALLADEMGLGKSAQVVVAADIVAAKNILVLCPASVRVNWSREFGRFSPMDRPLAVLFSGKDPVPDGGVVVCSYDLLAASEKTLGKLKSQQWDVLVLDEAHYLKERSAKRTKAIYGHNAKNLGLSGNSNRVWRLTGTPAPNDASELWTHLRAAGVVADPYWDFVFRYCAGFTSDYGYKITGHKNTDELKALLAPFMLRRKKAEVMKDLPPITFHAVTVERGDVELDPIFYEQISAAGEAKFFADLKVADQTLRAALKAVEASGTPAQDKERVLEAMQTSMVTLRRYVGMAKVPAIAQMLSEELEMGLLDKVVVFAIHRDVIEGLRRALEKYGATTLYGGTPPKKRQENIDKFRKSAKCRVFIGNIQAAGTGIDGLQEAAHEVAFAEMDWVPSNNAQAAMRCHRIGQTKPVRVRIFSLEGSSDEEVTRTLTRKTRELTKIF